MFSLLKSAGSGNRQERKITSEGKRARWPMEKESTCSRLATVSPPRNQRPKLRTCREWEGREGGKFAGNCLSLPQSGIALETISPPAPRISLCPREFQISFAEAETDRDGDCGSRKFSMAKSSIIAVSSSISSSLSLWCQCGDEPKECSTLCGAPISSIKSTGGWHSNSSEGGGGTMAGNTCE